MAASHNDNTTQVETYRRAFPTHTKPMLSYGIDFAESCRRHVKEYGASKVYIISSGTLSRKTDFLDQLKRGLGDMVVGERIGMKQHSLISECIEVLHDVRRCGADCVVTLGGSSLSDAAKAVTFAEANDVQTKEDLMKLPHMMAQDRPSRPTRMPYIFIPTTLSGAEYSAYAGVTDEATHIKYQLTGLQPADLVILSGEVAATTPLDMWIASGVRAIDHCCENLCTSQKRSWELVEPACVRGLQNLVPGMLRSVSAPNDARARLDSHLGVNFAMYGLHYGVYPGCSHGIGHIMGPMGVVHGQTSAVLMPAVHKYNAAANAADQAVVQRTLWAAAPATRELFESRGLDEASADLGDLLDAVVRALGQPRSLKDVGIVGRDRIELLARNSMEDPCVHTNPRKIETSEQVLQILLACE